MVPDQESLQLPKVFLQWCTTLVEYQALVLLKYMKNINKVVTPLHSQLSYQNCVPNSYSPYKGAESKAD